MFYYTVAQLIDPAHQVNKYAKELLAAMSSGMEEKDDPGKLIVKPLFLRTRK